MPLFPIWEDWSLPEQVEQEASAGLTSRRAEIQ